jgi:hypothetical protein
MKSLEVTLFLNQTPADGVASVVYKNVIKARHSQRRQKLTASRCL